MPPREQINHILGKLEWLPTEAQEPIVYSPARINFVCGGDRSGKSAVAEKYLMTRFWEGNLYWLVAADYERTRAEFEYIIEDLAKLKLPFEATKQIDPGEIRLENKIRIATKSAKDPSRLVMEPPDGVILCEAAQLDYETYLRVRGRIAEKRGWILAAGSLEDDFGWYNETIQRGQAPNPEGLVSFVMPTWSNIRIFPGGRDDPEIKALEESSPPEWFQRRFGAVAARPRGAVFQEFNNLIHVDTGGLYEFEPSKEVYIGVDPGYATAYAVEAVQIYDEHIYVIDEVFEHNLVTSNIITICKKRPWWNKVIGGAIDIAGTQHQGMPSPIETWQQEAGIGLNVNKVPIRDGIELVKTHLLVHPVTNSPNLHINAKCQGLISEFGGCNNPISGKPAPYRWKEDSKGNIVGEVPEDKNNHGVKALTYLLVDLAPAWGSNQRSRVRFIS